MGMLVNLIIKKKSILFDKNWLTKIGRSRSSFFPWDPKQLNTAMIRTSRNDGQSLKNKM